MTEEPPASVEERLARLDAAVADLKGRSNVQAWLHAELVHELRFIFGKMFGEKALQTPADKAAAARKQKMMERAARVDKIRRQREAAQAAEQTARTP